MTDVQVGDRVQGGITSEDFDRGVVLDVRQYLDTDSDLIREALVAWDTHVQMWTPVAFLEAEWRGNVD